MESLRKVAQLLRNIYLSLQKSLKVNNLKVSGSLKRKFVAVFVLIILVLGIINLATFIIMNSTTGKLNSMIDGALQVNTVINEAKNISEATDANGGTSLISSYMSSAAVNAQNENSVKFKKAITECLTKIENSINILEKDYIKDKDGLDALQQTKNIYNNFKETINTVTTEYENKNVATATPLVDKVGKTGSYLASFTQNIMSRELTASQQRKEVLSKQTALTGVIIVVVMIAIAVLSILIAYLFTRKITGAITKLAEASKSVAAGNLEASDIDANSNDEISVLAKSFNSMTENLRSLIKEISNSSSKVTSASELLKVGAEQNTKAIEQVAATTQQVSFEAADQSKRSGETVKVIHEMLKGNKKIYENVQMVLQTSDKATKVASIGNEKMEHLLRQISTIENKITVTQSTTQALKRQTGEIKKILDTISQIASQTNLLSKQFAC